MVAMAPLIRNCQKIEQETSQFTTAIVIFSYIHVVSLFRFWCGFSFLLNALTFWPAGSFETITYPSFALRL